MGGSIGQGLVFLIQTLFQFYLVILILYTLLRASGAHYVNPIVQFLIRVSEPLVKPLRKIIPESRRMDWAACIVIFLVQFVEIALLILLTGESLNSVGLIVYSLVTILKLIINIYFFAIIIFSLMSWIPSAANNPLNHVLFYLTHPLLKLVRERIPAISGIDLSPLIVLVLLQLISIVILQPLLGFAVGLM